MDSPTVITTIGVVSDTHLPDEGPLPPALYEQLNEVDLLIHLGDFNNLEAFQLFQQMKPLTAVYGNLDDDEICCLLPERKQISIGKYKLGLVHGWGPPSRIETRVRRVFPEADIILFGHSHTPYAEYHGRQLLFNPGSATCNRDGSKSFGLLELGESITHRIILLE